MKNSTILLSAMALLITFSSCKKIKEATQRDFEVTPDAITFTIDPISSTAAGTTLGTYNESLDLNALIKEYAPEFNEENIKKVEILSLTLELSGTDGTNDMSNFESMDVKIQTGSGAATTVASIASIPNTAGSTSITVPVTNSSDLKSYLSASSFNYTFTGKLRRQTTKALTAKLTVEYKFTAGL